MAAAEDGMEGEEVAVSPITMARGYCKTLPHSTDSSQHFYGPLASTSHITIATFSLRNKYVTHLKRDQSPCRAVGAREQGMQKLVFLSNH